MGEALRAGRGVLPFDLVTEVTPEQVAASLARLEVQVAHLTAAIERLSAHLERVENRQTVTERLLEQAQSAWWTVTKYTGALVGMAGGAAWVLEHGGKVAILMAGAK
jgi:ribosomal protein S15P/S13E